MRPSRNESLMEHARVAAKRSTCSRASVGVVIAREGRILVSGYNGAPSGMDHCSHPCTCKARDGVGQIPGDAVEIHLSSCASRQPCEISVHGEANAIAYAARWGVRIDGAELFTTFTPCIPCAQLVINSGILKVVYATIYRDQRGLELCRKAGIKTVYEEEMDLIG